MQSEANRAYWDSIADEYLDLTRRRLSEHSRVSELLGSLPLRQSPLDVLDLGTGCGLMAVYMARMGHRVTALDSSAEMLGRASALLREQGIEAECVLGDACDTGFPPSSFDVVVAKDLLFSVEACVDAIVHWKSLVRPGGYLVIIDGDYCYSEWNADFGRRRDYLVVSGRRDDLDVMMGGIDTSALREETERYYVNKVRRPGWEVWFLAGLGFVELRLEFYDDSEFETATKFGRIKVPVQYMIVARRPFEGEDRGLYTRPASEEPLDSASSLGVTSAMASGIRTEILSRLSSGEKTVSELNEGLGLESGHMSYHLRVLKKAGLVESRKSGRNSLYRLADPDRMNILLNTAASVASEERAPGPSEGREPGPDDRCR